jgi:hypothetical protein
VLDGQEPITLADIKRYKESNFAAVAEQLLQDRQFLTITSVASMADFVQCGNHMIVTLSTCNAMAEGVLCNFSMKDYEQGVKETSTEGTICFKVVDHKTVTMHGTANIAVDKEAQRLACYLKIRNRLDIKHIAPLVFVNYTGKQMSSSKVGSALTVAFGSIRSIERVTCSKLRKTAVTEVHSKYPDKKR